MLKFCGIAVMVLVFSSVSSPMLANSKSLLLNGVYAAAYGDFSADKGEWRNKEDFAAFRLKVGFQLIRVGFVGVTLGYQKVGFYNAERNLTHSNSNQTHFDYRGPLLELHLFPDALISFSIAGSQNDGYAYVTNKSGDAQASFGIDCKDNMTSCPAIATERSTLKIKEFTAQINYTVQPQLQVFVGTGTRFVEGKPLYEEHILQESGLKATEFKSYDQASWELDSNFLMLGVRGSTL